MKRRGFTVIELLVVIGIIALLGALLVMGIGRLIRNGKTNATNTDLANVRGMFDEVHAVSAVPAAPSMGWLWRNLAAPTILVVSTANGNAAGADFWNVPFVTPDPRGTPNPAIPDCLDAPPGALTIDNPIFRNGSRVVLNTQLAMRVLLAYKNNKDAFARLPADRWMIPTWEWTSPSPGLPHPGLDGILGTTVDDGTDLITQVTYAVNNCVQDLDQSASPPIMKTYRCIKENIADPTINEPYKDNPATPVYWVVDNNPTPVLLDGWNNPIIFVPASGLINVYGNVSIKIPVTISSSGYAVNLDANDTVSALPNTPGAPPTTGRFIRPIQSPDKRPYFVSAGPDGDLSTGDDNVYSFEK